MNEIVRCKDCKHGKFIVPCKEAKLNHELLRYMCSKIGGKHRPNFFCGYASKKEIKNEVKSKKFFVNYILRGYYDVYIEAEDVIKAKRKANEIVNKVDFSTIKPQIECLGCWEEE